MDHSSVRIAVLAIILALFGPAPAGGQAAVVRRSVLLRAGDSVRLEVGDEPTLTGTFVVDESGRVLFPLVGFVSVAGRDFEEVRRDVDVAFGRELSNRPLRIIPLLRIAVLGEVRQPGLYPVDPTYSMGDVLALAGGLGPEADRGRIQLVRNGRVQATASGADIDVLAQSLRSGDQVVVPRQSWVSANVATFVGAGVSLVVAVATTLLLR